MTLAWNAATDNVGVAGYDVFVNGAKVATTNSLTATVGGLACGTSYTVGVKAFDAAGNRSTLATTGGATAGCKGPHKQPRVSRLRTSHPTKRSKIWSFSTIQLLPQLLLMRSARRHG